MKEQNIPIGVADLRSIRDLDSYYVDKTPFIGRLFSRGKYYFLSRPRRFGKSLLLGAMRELFEGLRIHDRWDWSHTCPVVRLSFNLDYGAPGRWKPVS